VYVYVWVTPSFIHNDVAFRCLFGSSFVHPIGDQCICGLGFLYYNVIISFLDFVWLPVVYALLAPSEECHDILSSIKYLDTLCLCVIFVWTGIYHFFHFLHGLYFFSLTFFLSLLSFLSFTHFCIYLNFINAWWPVYLLFSSVDFIQRHF